VADLVTGMFRTLRGSGGNITGFASPTDGSQTPRCSRDVLEKRSDCRSYNWSWPPSELRKPKPLPSLTRCNPAAATAPAIPCCRPRLRDSRPRQHLFTMGSQSSIRSASSNRPASFLHANPLYGWRDFSTQVWAHVLAAPDVQIWSGKRRYC